MLAALDASFAAVACGSGETAADTSEGNLVNQFGQRSDALTLSDGGQCAIVTDPAAELLIRDVPVVEDPTRTVWTGNTTTTTADGAWTFGRLMTPMVDANDPSAFLAWGRRWERPETVNGFVVAPRANMNTLVPTPWLAASGGTRLDLTKAYFPAARRREPHGPAEPRCGLRGRRALVFGVLDSAGNPTQFTVTFEFHGIKAVATVGAGHQRGQDAASSACRTTKSKRPPDR